MKLLYIALCLLGSVNVIGCGGGGGGGSDSTTGIRVLHGAVDAVPVDLWSTGETPQLFARGTFALPAEYASVDEGQQTFQITRANTPSVAISQFSVDVESNGRYSVLMFGDNSLFGLRFKVLEDATVTSADQPILRVVSAATGAAAVRVDLDGGIGVSAPFGEASTYVSAPAGSSQIRVSRVVDGRLLARFPANLEPQRAYSVLVAGEAEYYVKVLLLVDR